MKNATGDSRMTMQELLDYARAHFHVELMPRVAFVAVNPHFPADAEHAEGCKVVGFYHRHHAEDWSNHQQYFVDWIVAPLDME
jgi:hypothetical protein